MKKILANKALYILQKLIPNFRGLVRESDQTFILLKNGVTIPYPAWMRPIDWQDE